MVRSRPPSTPRHQSRHERRLRVQTLTKELTELRQGMPLRERIRSGFGYGMRCVAAAAVSYYASRWLGLGLGFWAAITSIAVMQSTYADVRNGSRDQLMGALIGGGLGLASAVWGHDRFSVYLLAVMLSMVICWTLRMGAAGRIAAITATIVMLVPIGGTFAHVALMRVCEVALGALCALAITRVADWMGQRLAAENTA